MIYSMKGYEYIAIRTSWACRLGNIYQLYVFKNLGNYPVDMDTFMGKQFYYADLIKIPIGNGGFQ